MFQFHDIHPRRDGIYAQRQPEALPILEQNVLGVRGSVGIEGDELLHARGAAVNAEAARGLIPGVSVFTRSLGELVR